ncbi:MAG: hypothetical protein ACI9WC_002785, partial [Arenicella sp.]
MHQRKAYPFSHLRCANPTFLTQNGKPHDTARLTNLHFITIHEESADYM